LLTAAAVLTLRSASALSAAKINGGWSDIAIKAVEQFTISQRSKLKEIRALDIQRKVKIFGETIDKTNNEMTNDDDSKIIHFQRHDQGYHNLICDVWREEGRAIDFDSTDPTLNPVVRPELLDPPLTETGRQQCSLRRLECSLLSPELIVVSSPELIVVSPLLRCIQTAKISFRDRTGVPWISHEGCRE